MEEDLLDLQQVDMPLTNHWQAGLFAPKSPVSSAPLAITQGYYRSKIIAVQNGINPLITAATPLLNFISNLHLSHIKQEANILYQEITHEIKAFEAMTQTLGYRSENILVARYILCATLDELILTSAWEQKEQWQKHKLLNSFHNEDWGGERIFLILDRLSADPSLHIDLLELLYLCLSLGYLGKYQFIENGKLKIEEISEKLYQLIRWQRGDFKKQLAIPLNNPTEISNHIIHPDTLSANIISAFTLVLLVSLYLGFNFWLGNQVIPVYQELNSILLGY